MIRHGELKYIASDLIEVGMYNPKSGTDKDIVVINFYVSEESVLPQINDYLEYMPLKTFISVSNSNYMDEDGNYVVFIEIEKTKNLFEDFLYVVKEITNLTGFDKWKIQTYKHKRKTFKVEDLRSVE